MKIRFLVGSMILFCFSCGNKEDILLPKADRTVVKEVVDWSPIYIFFRVAGKDTLVEVNRKNSIITTNWLLNIDKRLPLRLVIPEVIKLQQRKREDKAHQNELAQNYYSYADSVGKNLAFLPFTNVYYKTESPKNGIIVFFAKDGKITINNQLVSKEELLLQLSNYKDKKDQLQFGFDKNSSYGRYIQTKIFINSLSVKKVPSEEFIY